MKPIRIDMTDEQRSLLEPLFAEVARINRDGGGCLVAGQAFRDGIVFGVIDGDRAKLISGKTKPTASTSFGHTRVAGEDSK